tara:strand:+ start:1045 stop:1623 length:579 start_codon:yes stop_codon:yes gene_type:complete
MALVDLQSIGVVNQIDKLQPTDLSTEGPSMDAKTMAMTYGIEPAWLNMGVLGMSQFGIDINGVNITQDMTALTTQVAPATPAIDILQQQYWMNIYMRLYGTGTVANIEIQVNWIPYAAAGAADRLVQVRRTVANPGTLTVGPCYAPPGWDIMIETATNGGAGDLLGIVGVAVQSPLGTPVPLFPGLTSPLAT